MPTTFNGTRVEAIPGAPLPFGLLSAAAIIDATDTHELNGIEWLPLSCAEAFTTDWCVDPPASYPKTGSSPEVARAEAVAVYNLFDCPPIGIDRAEAEQHARSGLALGEPRALEAWFQANVMMPAATDVTPTAGTAIDVVRAVSLLEANLAATYGGVGVIHAPASSAAWLGDRSQLVREGARYTTWLGNRVALGAGYEISDVGPGNTPAGAGEAWMYITGPVIGRREAVALLPGDDGESIDIVNNDRLLLAERAWVLGFECAAYAVLVGAE